MHATIDDHQIHGGKWICLGSSTLSAPRVGSGCCFVCNSLIFARVRTFSPSSTEEQEIQEDQKENKKTDSVCVCLDVAYLSCWIDISCKQIWVSHRAAHSSGLGPLDSKAWWQALCYAAFQEAYIIMLWSLSRGLYKRYIRSSFIRLGVGVVNFCHMPYSLVRSLTKDLTDSMIDWKIGM